VTRDPATEVWREAMAMDRAAAMDALGSMPNPGNLREQVHGLLDGFKPEPGKEMTVERMRGFWQACSRHRDHLLKKLGETQQALAASQADLTRAEAERDALTLLLAEARRELADTKPCAWRGLAVDAMRERDYARAQLGDLIAEHAPQPPQET